MKVRWWRVGVVFERDAQPHTQTLHVRAFTERNARALVATRLGVVHHVHVMQGSEPLMRVAETEEIVASFGPYARDWADPELASLRAQFAPGTSDSSDSSDAPA